MKTEPTNQNLTSAALDLIEFFINSTVKTFRAAMNRRCPYHATSYQEGTVASNESQR
jgi:hypothetical protein